MISQQQEQQEQQQKSDSYDRHVPRCQKLSIQKLYWSLKIVKFEYKHALFFEYLGYPNCFLLHFYAISFQLLKVSGA